jgi:hypothetical protein
MFLQLTPHTWAPIRLVGDLENVSDLAQKHSICGLTLAFGALPLAPVVVATPTDAENLTHPAYGKLPAMVFDELVP